MSQGSREQEEEAPLLNRNHTPNDPAEEETNTGVGSGGHRGPGGGPRTPRPSNASSGVSRRRQSSPYAIENQQGRFNTRELCLIFACVVLFIISSIFLGMYYRGRTERHQPGGGGDPIPVPDPPPEKNKTKEEGICLSRTCVLTAASLIQDMDQKADPCEDFYQYSCGGWLERNIIPDDKARYGYFDSLYEENQKILKIILESDDAPLDDDKDDGPSLPPPDHGSDQYNFYKLKDAYQSCTDEKRISELGGEPLKQILDEILKKFPVSRESPFFYFDDGYGKDTGSVKDSIDKESLMNTLAYLTRIGVSALFEFVVDADAKKPEINALYISQSGLGLPSKEYYNEKDILTVYEEVISDLLEKALHVVDNGNDEFSATSTEPAQSEEDTNLLGSMISAGLKQYQKNELAEIARKIVDFEKKLANISLSAEELSDPEATYNKHTLPSLNTLSPVFYWSQLLVLLSEPSGALPTEVILTSDSYFQSLSNLVNNTSAETMQFYFLSQAVLEYAEHLNESFRAPIRRLEATLKGVDDSVRPRRWQVCLQVIDDVMGFMAGRFFVLKTFGGDSKAMADQLIASIRESFVKRLPLLDWLDDETREKAIGKVDKIIQKVGYPENSPNTMDPKNLTQYYDDLEVKKDAYFDNVINGNKWLSMRDWRKIGKPVDRGEWHMTPQTVNAYYNPTANEIVFPAGILQPPFFSAKNPEYINYGAIGVVIGHELTHAFDNTGRQYDETGRLIQWWSNATIEAFNNKTECFVDQYANYTVKGPQGEDVNLNGKLTLGENLADNGGLKEAYDAWLAGWTEDPDQKTHKNQLLPGLGNMTRDQLFYVSFARLWCSKIRPENAIERVRTDPHSPAQWRVIGALQNSRHFAKTFGCKSGLFMNPEQKCTLW